jgi:cytochrome c
MKHIATFLILLMLVACAKKETKVLVFSKTKGFRHASIVEGKAALLKMGSENNFNVDTTEDSSVFNEDNLKQYDAIIFLSTTGDVFDAQQQNAFTRYIQAGGGFVGIHAATDTEYDWPWYNKLVGGYFASHPHNQVATLNVVDRTHESTKHLDAQWKRLDEWYNFKQLNPETKKLINIDESTYEGGTNGKDHPMSWYHEYDGGRAWYTALGHTKESFVEENFLQHILGGIKYAIGSKKKDYSKAKIPLRPDQDRFTVKKLIEGQLFEPTEMAILPNSDVLIAQRRGEIMKYDNKTGLLSQIGKIPVYDKAENSNGNAEEGLMGLKHDPDFANNQLIYLFYAHKDSAVNRLSQFKYLGDSIDFASEKVVLDVKSTRNILLPYRW